MNIPAARLDRIRSLVAQRGIVSVRDLSEDLGVSEVTVRRDFALLEQAGVLRRTRGGALSTDRPAANVPYDERRQIEANAKALIGAAAAALVARGDTIFLSSGTTALAMAHRLAGLDRVTVISNSTHAISVLMVQPGITVISTGGWADAEGGGFSGPLAEAALALVRARKAFIGCSGISREGVTNDSLERAAIDRHMIEAAEEVYVLADHTKFGRQSLAMVAGFDAVTAIVTDPAAPRRELEALQAIGARVIVAHEHEKGGRI